MTRIQKTCFQRLRFLDVVRGFSLLEVVIAMALIAICVAGGLYLHQRVYMSVQEMRYRTAAAIATESLLASIRMNAASLEEGAYDYLLNVDGASTLAQANLPLSCFNAPCTGRQMATLDLYLFEQQLGEFMGSDVTAAVEFVPADPPPSDPADANRLSVRIQWNASELTGGLLPNACSEGCYELSTMVCANLGNCL